MSDKKNNHKDYTEKPYDFSPKKQTKEEKVAEAQAQAEVWMKQWVAATQKMFKNKE
jgi:O-succinylbenzoate synthase